MTRVDHGNEAEGAGAPAQERSAQVRGTRLAYTVTGDGPLDVVWGHGLGQTRAQDEAMGLLRWPEVPARVLRYDARGHGASPTTPELEGSSWAELALDQLELATAAGFGAYVAGGASMGCGTALHVAAAAPDRIRGLVLVIPPTAWETRAAQAAQWSTFAAIVRGEGGIDAAIEAARARPVPDPFVGDDAHRARGEAGLRAWDPDRLAHAWLGAATADLPPRDVVAGLTAPALLLAWTGDPVHPIGTAEELAGLLPQAELVVASTRGDLDAWTGAVVRFLQLIAGTGPG